MASIHPKKVAAAVAAVLQYVAEAEAALVAPAAASPDRSCAVAPAMPPLWGWAGRQEAMHDRATWQRRLAKSW